MLRKILLAAVMIASGAACKRPSPVVVVYTSVDQVFSEPIFKEFELQTGMTARAVFDTEETKSTGVLNRLIAEAQTPQADVFWSGDPVRPFLLARRGQVEPYISPNSESIPAAFKAGDGSWTGFAARARVLLLNRNRLGKGEPPTSIKDLADPRWKGQVALANPLFGTTTMHAAAWFAVWGDEKAKTFFGQLKENGVKIASSNGEVKRLVATGEVAFGLTDTDDAFEALQDGAPVEVVFPDQAGEGALVMPTSVVLIKGAPHPDQGRKLIDFLLRPQVEERLAESAAHLPLRAQVPVPEKMKRPNDLKSMQVDYATIATEMERIQPWLREWVGL